MNREKTAVATSRRCVACQVTCGVCRAMKIDSQTSLQAAIILCSTAVEFSECWLKFHADERIGLLEVACKSDNQSSCGTCTTSLERKNGHKCKRSLIFCKNLPELKYLCRSFLLFLAHRSPCSSFATVRAWFIFLFCIRRNTYSTVEMEGEGKEAICNSWFVLALSFVLTVFSFAAPVKKTFRPPPGKPEAETIRERSDVA